MAPKTNPQKPSRPRETSNQKVLVTSPPWLLVSRRSGLAAGKAPLPPVRSERRGRHRGRVAAQGRPQEDGQGARDHDCARGSCAPPKKRAGRTESGNPTAREPAPNPRPKPAPHEKQDQGPETQKTEVREPANKLSPHEKAAESHKSHALHTSAKPPAPTGVHLSETAGNYKRRAPQANWRERRPVTSSRV